jgi:1L-myo-inositol 1-phosphate cytidylyltransferase
MQRLAFAQRAGTMDIGSSWWIDVDDPAAHALAERDFLKFLPHFLVAA